MHPSRFSSGIALIVLALVLCLSCAKKAPEISPAPGVYPAPEDTKFSVKVTPARFSIGEPITLEASLFNGGKDAFHKEFPTGCQWDFEVANETGRVLTPQRMCTMALSELHLAPGELRMMMREWKGNDDYFGITEPLAPGRYSVSAGFLDENLRVIPMSEPVWIEIMAPRSKR
ncbi:MAG TPA: BsuPI-related putative proteinase inhibitor [Candidatus Krumholzibacteria bacterium]|nr:BsuPI-related putative proteinase inhibitor [Candidatus Krumholzibacteria bacterium]